MPKFTKGLSRIRTKGVWREVDLKKTSKPHENKSLETKPHENKPQETKPNKETK